MPGDIGDKSVQAGGPDGGPSWTQRVARYGALSARLATLGDSEVMGLLEDAVASTEGIGGITAKATVDGVPVFLKRVPLTDLERCAENVGSTANVFQLPMFYQYGIGSTGFGVWREVAVHAMTTRWVLNKRFDGFPLLYHWRVLPQSSHPMDLSELQRWVTRWEGSDAVRFRLEAIGLASAAVVLFTEYIPHTVDSWMTAQAAAGDETAETAYTFVHLALRQGVEFMAAQGLLHFDAHFRNVLTDGNRLYFADFGLAIHSGFDLTDAESAFLRRHRDYDRCYTVTHLTHWLVSNLLKIPWSQCPAYIRENALNLRNSGLPESAARIVARHAPVAVILGDFLGALANSSKCTPFPAEDLSRALSW